MHPCIFHKQWLVACLLVVALTGCSASRGGASGSSAWTADCLQFEGRLENTPGNVTVVVDYLIAATDDGYQARTYSAHDRLIYLDCNGRFRSGAATSWTSPDGGETWVFDLRKDLYDTDGKLLDAAAVAEYFEGASNKPFGVSAVALGPYQLAIVFSRSYNELPAVLLSNRFAIPVANTSGVTHVGPAADGDVRDQMDAGAGAVITTNPSVIEYAGLLSDWTSHPLAWDRTYVLIIAGPMSTSGTLPETVVDDLARSIMGPDAQRRDAQDFWASSNACDSSDHSESNQDLDAAQLASLVAHYDTDAFLLDYAVQDPVARTIAERLVALNSGAIDVDGADSLRALMQFGNAPGQWIAHQSDRIARTGLEPVHAIVTAIPNRTFARCEEVGAKFTSIASRLMLSPDQQLLVLPIVNMRPRLLVRDKRLQVVQDARNVMLLSVPQQAIGDMP